MRILRRFVLAVVATVFVASVFAVSASALRSFSVRNTTLSESSSALTFAAFDETERETGAQIICAVTLSGTLASTFAKTRGAVAGHMTSGRVAEERCTESGPLGGRARFTRESFPQEMTYESFEGTLPRITGVRFSRFVDVSIANAMGALCQYQGNVAVIIQNGLLIFRTPNRVFYVSGMMCPVSHEMRGTKIIAREPTFTLL